MYDKKSVDNEHGYGIIDTDNRRTTMKNKKPICYLDMDGTIYPLYDIPNWLPRLRQEDATVFNEREPMIREKDLMDMLSQYDVRILSMTPKGATKEYCEQVIAAKNEWLDKHFPSITKRIYMKYGNNKNLKNSEQALLIDDNDEIRKNFKGKALPPLWW